MSRDMTTMISIVKANLWNTRRWSKTPRSHSIMVVLRSTWDFLRWWNFSSWRRATDGVIIVSITCWCFLGTCHPKDDCILYRGPEYEDLEKCPICGLVQFNHRKDDGDEENCNGNRRKGGPKKVFSYFSIIPHLKRCFANKESELLRWHKEKHKQEARMIRHPADAHSGKTLIHEIMNLPLIRGILGS
jgi:hypothetical protein